MAKMKVCYKIPAHHLISTRFTLPSINITRPFTASLIMLCVIPYALSHFYLYAAECVLRDVIQQRAPVIKNKRVTYTMDLVFDNTPKNYWIFYDKKAETLVIDIYGSHIQKAKTLKIPPSRGFFRGVETSNHNTAMSLSGLQSKIKIGADDGWHFEASTLDTSVIRISAWKNIEKKSDEPKKNIGVVLTFCISAVCLVSGFIIAIIIVNSRE